MIMDILDYILLTMRNLKSEKFLIYGFPFDKILEDAYIKPILWGDEGHIILNKISNFFFHLILNVFINLIFICI